MGKNKKSKILSNAYRQTSISNDYSLCHTFILEHVDLLIDWLGA